MGRFGAAYGIPFAVEGLFFFLEAIFVAIYIYGWNRHAPVAALLDRRPGRAGRASAARSSVVAANGWMNQPGGFTVRDGRVVDVDPLGGVLQPRLLVRGPAHAAGRLHGRRLHRRRRLRRRACCAAAGDRYHRLGLAIPLTVAGDRDPAADPRRRRRRPRGRSSSEPAKFAAIELLPRTGHARARDARRRRWSTASRGTASRSRRAPRCSSGFSPATTDRRARRDPAAVRPADHLVTTVHLAFDVMVGIGVRAAGPGALVRVPLVAAARGAGEPLVPARRGDQRRRSPSSRSRPAGSSPRSAASRGPSSACC